MTVSKQHFVKNLPCIPNAGVIGRRKELQIAMHEARTLSQQRQIGHKLVTVIAVGERVQRCNRHTLQQHQKRIELRTGQLSFVCVFGVNPLGPGRERQRSVNLFQLLVDLMRCARLQFVGQESVLGNIDGQHFRWEFKVLGIDKVLVDRHETVTACGVVNVFSKFVDEFAQARLESVVGVFIETVFCEKNKN
jgi:hypothetical protein